MNEDKLTEEQQQLLDYFTDNYVQKSNDPLDPTNILMLEVARDIHINLITTTEQIDEIING
jgi:hypothetical protein